MSKPRVSKAMLKIPTKQAHNVRLTNAHTKDYINEFDRLNGLSTGITYKLGNEIFITKSKRVYHEIN